MKDTVVALLAVITAIAAGVFSTLLLVTNEFVEVFVQEPNDELSCKIGFLGVYQAGFDPTCLGETSLEESGLGSTSPLTKEKTFNVEAFDSDTLDFKLLFVAQTEFYTELNPLTDVGVPNPEFENCEQYLDELKAQPDLYNTVAPLVNADLFGGFVTPVTNDLFNGYFNDELTGISTLVGGIAQAMDKSITNILVGAVGYTTETIPADKTVTVYATELKAGANGALSGSLITSELFSIVDRIADALLNQEADVTNALNAAGGSVSFTAILQTTFNVLQDLNVTESLKSTTDFSSTFCEAFTADATSPCNMAQMVGVLRNASSEAFLAANATLATATPASPEDIDLADKLFQGWSGIALLVESFTVGNDVYDGADTNVSLTAPFFDANDTPSVGQAVLNSFVPPNPTTAFPAQFSDSFPPCELLKAVGQLPDATPCSFENFILPAGRGSGLGLAAQVTFAASPASLATVEGFSGLFADCADATLPPNFCYTFFPTVIIATAYQDEALGEGFNPVTNKAVAFENAKSYCEDDEKDADAISKAQTLGPIGNALIYLGAVAGLLGIAKPLKAVSALAAIFCLGGAALVLAAILEVYSAPVYSSVGEDAELYEIKYVAGTTVIYGLTGIALGGLAGILYIVRIFTTMRSGDEDALEGHKLKTYSL